MRAATTSEDEETTTHIEATITKRVRSNLWKLELLPKTEIKKKRMNVLHLFEGLSSHTRIKKSNFTRGHHNVEKNITTAG